jgi:hypothetical protein
MRMRRLPGRFITKASSCALLKRRPRKEQRKPMMRRKMSHPLRSLCQSSLVDGMMTSFLKLLVVLRSHNRRQNLLKKIPSQLLPPSSQSNLRQGRRRHESPSFDHEVERRGPFLDGEVDLELQLQKRPTLMDEE